MELQIFGVTLEAIKRIENINVDYMSMRSVSLYINPKLIKEDKNKFFT